MKLLLKMVCVMMIAADLWAAERYPNLYVDTSTSTGILSVIPSGMNLEEDDEAPFLSLTQASVESQNSDAYDNTPVWEDGLLPYAEVERPLRQALLSFKKMQHEWNQESLWEYFASAEKVLDIVCENPEQHELYNISLDCLNNIMTRPLDLDVNSEDVKQIGLYLYLQGFYNSMMHIKQTYENPQFEKVTKKFKGLKSSYLEKWKNLIKGIQDKTIVFKAYLQHKSGGTGFLNKAVKSTGVVEKFESNKEGLFEDYLQEIQELETELGFTYDYHVEKSKKSFILHIKNLRVQDWFNENDGDVV